MSEFLQTNIIYGIVTFVPLLLIFCSISNRYAKLLLALFTYGVVISPIAALINQYFCQFAPSDVYIVSSITPIVEEFFKSLPALIMLLFRKGKTEMNAIFATTITAAGFSIFESLNYLLYQVGDAHIIELALLRANAASLVHISATGIVAILLYLFKDNREYLFALYWGALSIAIVIHSLYNLLLTADLVLLALGIALFAWIGEMVLARKMKPILL